MNSSKTHMCARMSRFSGCLGFLGIGVVGGVVGSPLSALAQATNDPIISLQISGLDATEPWTFGNRDNSRVG